MPLPFAGLQLRRLQPVRHRHAAQRRSSAARYGQLAVLGAVARRHAAGSSPGARSASPRRTTIGRSCDGREHYDENIRQRPAHAVRLAAASADPADLGARRVRPGLHAASAPATRPRPTFAVPADQVAHGAARRRSTRSAPAGTASVWWNPRAAHRLAAVGLARDPASIDPAHARLSALRRVASLRSAVAVAARWPAASRGPWMAGRDLDRFSRYRVRHLRQPAARLSVGADPLRSRRRPAHGGRVVGRRAAARSTGSSIRRWCTIPASGAGCATTPGVGARARGAGAVRHARRGRVGLRLPGRQRRRRPGHARRPRQRATKSFDGGISGRRAARRCRHADVLHRRLSSTRGDASTAASSRAAADRSATGVDLVHFGVVVTDKQGAPITGLTADDFEIVEAGKPQSIKYLRRRRSRGRAAAAHRVPARHERQHGGGHQGRRAPPRSSSSTRSSTRSTSRSSTSTPKCASRASAANDYPRLIERIRGAQARRLDGALRRARRLPERRREQDGQKILVLYTDGGDTRSSLTLSDVARPAARRPTSRSTSIGYLEHQSQSARTQQRSSSSASRR